MTAHHAAPDPPTHPPKLHANAAPARLCNGIMSAIDFSMDIVRQPESKEDRVNVVLSGKFLPYKQY